MKHKSVNEFTVLMEEERKERNIKNKKVMTIQKK
jgi:hypothetical protein